ncbi:hypothetical protein WA158_000370 [Blastocystis sp. Blastoise]
MSDNVLDVSEAYLHLSKNYMKFDLKRFNNYYDSFTKTFSFVNKNDGTIFMLFSSMKEGENVITWTVSNPISFVPLDSIITIKYSRDHHFMAIQRSEYLVDMYDLTNGKNVSISVKRKTGGIMKDGVFFASIPDPSYDKKSNIHPGSSFIIITMYEIQLYHILHIKHIYKCIKTISTSCNSFSYVHEYNMLYTYIIEGKESTVRPFLLTHSSIAKLPVFSLPASMTDCKIDIIKLYNNIYIFQYVKTTGIVYITDFPSIAENKSTFKFIQLPIKGDVSTIYMDNLLIYISNDMKLATPIDVRVLNCVFPLTPIAMTYDSSSNDFTYKISSDNRDYLKKDYIFTEDNLGLNITDSIQQLIHGYQCGTKYQFFDNGICVKSSLDNSVPEHSHVTAINGISTLNIPYADCVAQIKKLSRPLTLTIETGNISKEDSTYYPLLPIYYSIYIIICLFFYLFSLYIYSSIYTLTDDEVASNIMSSSDCIYIYPCYILNTKTGYLFEIFMDIHKLSPLLSAEFIYPFTSSRTNNNPIYIYVQSNYKESPAEYNPLYLNDEVVGVTHIPLENTRNSEGTIIISQCDMISYVFDFSLYSRDLYTVLHIYISDYFLNLLSYVSFYNLPDSTRLLLLINPQEMNVDIYNALIHIGIENLRINNKWRDICITYYNYRITSACNIIIHYPTFFESGRQIWIRQLFQNALQKAIMDKNPASNTSEGGNELSRILGEIPEILNSEEYSSVKTLFGL